MSQQQEKRKNSLANSFQELLRHEPLEKITVEQICQQAGVHRSTFYRYFQDKYDLLRYAFDIFLVAHVDEEDIIGSTIAMINREKQLFRNVSINNDSNFLFYQMIDILSKHLLTGAKNGKLESTPWLARELKNSQYPPLVAEMMAGAFLTLLFKWISSNYQMKPEELSNFLANLGE
ncbi:TetR/AcrR family transcriptional regulator [Ligilactobacillus sp. WILCCON 0076]|uniref:TetR/AcrR family transcriptional regulator n=1 Tax=Ligilactobacillus ubinensis TaxID=2876789 RepID=A0A9X2FKN1_9LACO|nr:TetR family transcriptional regulator [Ligilactobacillus ubinensis]MCP0886098.1 TetR/AcrR family transcriptional regulator [Ligilactobacillus ubinensis]